MELSCFSSSDPHAVNATQLYDDNVAEGNLWMRGGQNSLPLCPPISPPLDGRCLVCLEQKVYAVCRNLMAGVKMVMEADGHNIKISESECPKPPSDDVHSGQLSAGVITAIVMVFIFIIIIIAGVVGYKYRKRSKTQKEPNEFNMQTIRPDGTTQVLMEEGGENNIKHDD